MQYIGNDDLIWRGGKERGGSIALLEQRRRGQWIGLKYVVGPIS
jgi:hypothetical protein